MGANFLILALSAASLQHLPPDTTSSDSSLASPMPPARVGPDTSYESRAGAVGYEQLTDALRYDRVQGVSVGLGYRMPLPPVKHTLLYATVRYGFTDERITGRLTMARDAPEGRIALSGFRDIANLDPFAPGHGLGNTLDALFVAHDNADYALTAGGSLAYEAPLSRTLALGLGMSVQRQESVERRARSSVNDFLGGSGRFPANPPVSSGTYGTIGATVRGSGKFGWRTTADILAGEGRSTARVYGSLQRDFGGRRGATIELKAGLASAPTLRQSEFRLGGVSTVRGFEYGTSRGQAFWAARLDIAPIRARFRPVAFIDAGQAASAADLFSSTALVGAGVGLSFLNGLLRFDFSRPLSPDTGGKVRFDIVVQGVR
jgi:Haemolysin secretion/activation protein ShlB/FhaC/HecB